MEGRNLVVERRYANGELNSLDRLAAELAAAKVEVLVTNGPNPTKAAMRATTAIPIVFGVASDPILSGLVQSLARPGGNVTGFSANGSEVTRKLLALLKEAIPAIRSVGVLEVVGNPQFDLIREGFDKTCQTVGLKPVYARVALPSDIDAAITTIAAKGVQGLVLVSDSFTIHHQRTIIASALRKGVPTVGFASDVARDGALATYSVRDSDVADRSAYYVNKILLGARPADLPVEEPSRFDLVLNVRTARELGIALPRALLLQANELIE